MHPLRLLAALPLFVAGLAQAQAPAWPAAKPITLIVPYSAGGSVDFISRMVATRLGERLKQSVVIENVSGAGGAIGVAKAAAAAPDGYTIVAAPDSTIAIGKLVNPAAYKFDPLKDLTPVGMLNTAPMVLVARPGLPVKSYDDFVKLAKASPGKYSYASSGNGGATHMAMEYYKSLSGLRIVHVPYRGTGPALNDVVGGQVDMIFDTLASSYPHIKAGTLIPMAVAAPQRAGELPNVPTFVETGLKSFNEGFWNGVLAPAGLPPEVLKTLHAATLRALRTQAVKDRYAATGALVVEDTPEAFAALITADVAKWKKVAEFGKISAD